MSDGNRGLVERIFQDAQFVRSLGIELTACGNGWCEAKLKVSFVVRQQHGFIHAGALMTAATVDSAHRIDSYTAISESLCSATPAGDAAPEQFPHHFACPVIA